MKKITQLDLKNAFKALDDIEIPQPVLTESIRKLPTASALTEEFYDIDNEEDMETATAEREDEIAKAKLAKIEKIVDLDAESPEDLEPSYAGKTIIQCPQCMTMFYKDPKDVIISEDDETVCNIGEKCQHCGNASGYTLIGKVAPVDDVELTSFEEAPAEEGDIDQTLDEIPEKEQSEEVTDEAEEEVPAEEEISAEDTDEIPEEDEDDKKNESLKEDISNEAWDHKTEESDQVLHGIDNAVVDCKVAKVITHSEDEKPVDCKGEKKPLEKPLTEDALPELTDANVDKLLDSEEFKKPISEEEVDQIIDDSKNESIEPCDKEDEECFDNIEDVDDASVNECVSKFLTEVYENVSGFEMTDCSLEENKLIIEGKINFKTGNSNQTSFSLTNVDSLLEGYNDTFGNDSKFSIGYKIKDKTLSFESIDYKYHIGENLVEGLIK